MEFKMIPRVLAIFLLITLLEKFYVNGLDSKLYCQDKIYHRSPAILQFYEQCSFETSSNTCRMACLMRKLNVLRRDGSFDSQISAQWLKRDFGEHAKAIIDIFRKCRTENVKGNYVETENCVNFEPIVTCIQRSWLEICGHPTQDGINTEGSAPRTHKSVTIGCQGFVYRRSATTIQLANECRKKPKSTNGFLACFWRKLGFIDKDGVLHPEEIFEWLKQDITHFASLLSDQFQDCAATHALGSNFNPLKDAESLGPLVQCFQKAWEETCKSKTIDFVSDVNTELVEAPVKPFTVSCGGKVIERHKIIKQTWRDCRAHIFNFNCRAVCFFRRLNILNNAGTFDFDKFSFWLKLDIPSSQADHIIQHARGCAAKYGAYNGDAACDNFTPHFNCIKDGFQQACGTTTDDFMTTQAVDKKFARCREKIFPVNPITLAAKNKCNQEHKNSWCQRLCLFRAVGSVRPDNTIDYAKIRGITDLFPPGVANATISKFRQCHSKFPSFYTPDEGCTDIAAVIRCGKHAFKHVCGFTTLDFVTTMD